MNGSSTPSRQQQQQQQQQQHVVLFEDDVVYWMLNFLQRRGLVQSMRALEKEAGICTLTAINPEGLYIRSLVLDGKWGALHKALDILLELRTDSPAGTAPQLLSATAAQRIKFLVKKQEYLELLAYDPAADDELPEAIRDTVSPATPREHGVQGGDGARGAGLDHANSGNGIRTGAGAANAHALGLAPHFQSSSQTVLSRALLTAVVALLADMKQLCASDASHREFSAMCQLLTHERLSQAPGYEAWSRAAGRLALYDELHTLLHHVLTSSRAGDHQANGGGGGGGGIRFPPDYMETLLGMGLVRLKRDMHGHVDVQVDVQRREDDGARAHVRVQRVPACEGQRSAAARGDAAVYAAQARSHHKQEQQQELSTAHYQQQEPLKAQRKEALYHHSLRGSNSLRSEVAAGDVRGSRTHHQQQYQQQVQQQQAQPPTQQSQQMQQPQTPQQARQPPVEGGASNAQLSTTWQEQRRGHAHSQHKQQQQQQQQQVFQQQHNSPSVGTTAVTPPPPQAHAQAHAHAHGVHGGVASGGAGHRGPLTSTPRRRVQRTKTPPQPVPPVVFDDDVQQHHHTRGATRAPTQEPAQEPTQRPVGTRDGGVDGAGLSAVDEPQRAGTPEVEMEMGGVDTTVDTAVPRSKGEKLVVVEERG